MGGDDAGGSRDLRALPKAHLHVHVESTIRPDTLRELADANGVPLPPPATASFTGFGHGIRVLDDQALVAELAARGVPLEVCPSSNVVLGFAPSWPEHPLPRLLAAGLTVTLNTDIPLTTSVSLTDEYARARDTFGYCDQVLADLALASVSASFAPEATTRRLRAGITAWLCDEAYPRCQAK